MNMPILETEQDDFISTVNKITGGGFSYKCKDGEMWISENIPELLDWKNTPEYISLKREQKLQAKYEKEQKKLLWGEVKKNKDADLDADDLAEVDKKLGEL